MKLIVLGSGTSVPHPKRSSSGYWLEAGGGTLLLDCSVTALSRMLSEGVDWANLDSVWISHFHLDHCGGLPPLLAGLKHSAQMKTRRKPLTLCGPVGLGELIDRFSSVNNYKLLEQPFPLRIVEVEPLERFEIVPDLEAVAMSTPHTEESHAIHLRDLDGSTMVHTSDTGFTETLATFARMVDLLVIEASFPAHKPAEKHLDLAEAMYLIRKAAPKRAILTHLYPEWDSVDLETELGKFALRCEVVLAYDGMTVPISGARAEEAPGD